MWRLEPAANRCVPETAMACAESEPAAESRPSVQPPWPAGAKQALGSADWPSAPVAASRVRTAIAPESDLVLVVGSPNSSNSRRLVEVAERAGTRAHLVDGADELHLSWFAGVATVGVTAGASAPEELVCWVIDRLDPAQRREAMRVVREARWSGAPVPAVRASPQATFGRAL